MTAGPPDYGEVPPPDEEFPRSPATEGRQETHSQPAAAETQPSHPPVQPPVAGPQAPSPEKVETSKEAGPETSHQPIEVHPHEKDIRKYWQDFIAYVKDRIVWMAQDLIRARVKEVGSELQLHYNEPAECSLLRQKENKNQLTEFVLDFFQKELTVHFILPKVEDNAEENGAESPHQKRQQLANDPLTIMAAEIFHGQVGDIRIGPRSR